MAWLEALEAVKDMFPRMSNSELMAPVDNVTVSTDRLRQKLLEEGLSESAIQESEQIMKSEFASLQSQLRVLRQKYWLLTDTLRQLEVCSFWTTSFYKPIPEYSSVCLENYALEFLVLVALEPGLVSLLLLNAYLSGCNYLLSCCIVI